MMSIYNSDLNTAGKLHHWKTAWKSRGKLYRPPVMSVAIMALIMNSIIAGFALPAPSARADDRLPIYDMHVHYNEPAWIAFDPPYIKQLLDEAKVVRILVGSWPDTGTRKLLKALPEIIVPTFNPYRGDINASNWTRHPDRVLPYMRERLAETTYAGIGEFHIYDVNNVDWKVIEQVMEMAREKGLFLHVHSDEKAIERLYDIDPRANILWAHTGLGVTADRIDATMKKFKSLRAELSLRAINIISEDEGSDIRPEWRKVLIAHQDRLMVGTDTYNNISWAEYGEIVAAHRRWLKKLPRSVAAKIAHKNAERFIRRWYPKGAANKR